jgi:hypothetical protein
MCCRHSGVVSINENAINEQMHSQSCIEPLTKREEPYAPAIQTLAMFAQEPQADTSKG